MNQKLIFCITFLVIFCCDISISFAALENNVGDFDDINKTLTIYDNESTVMTVRLISAVPDIGTFTEIFEVSNFEAYIPDKDNDFKARTVSYAGSGVTDVEWFIEQNVSYVVNVTDYGIKEVEEIIYNNKTGKNETVVVDRTVITGYHDETRYKDVWVDYQPYDKVMSKDQFQRIKVVYHKIPELGLFRIQTVPVFRGVECPELTWWSGSWDRRRAILIDNTVGDAVNDYQLRSVNLSLFGINAVSARIVNITSGLEESFWNETVDVNGNLECVWCNFSSLPTGGWINSTYYLYYQISPVVGSASDIENTFIDGSNFSDLAGWTQQAGIWSVSSGELIRDSSSTWVYLRRDTIAPTGNYIIETKYKKSGRAATLWDCDNPMTYLHSNSIDDNLGTIMIADDWSLGASDTYSFNSVTYYIYSIYRVSGAQYVKVSDTSRNLLAETGTTINGSGTGRYLGFAYCTAASSVDWVIVRKYTVAEPEPWTVGPEEEYPTPTPTPTLAPTTLIPPAQYDELDLPLILYILTISMLYLLIAFRHGVAAVELSLIYLIFAFFFLLFQTVTISINYIYLTLFLLLFLISIAGITKQGAD